MAREMGVSLPVWAIQSKKGRGLEISRPRLFLSIAQKNPFVNTARKLWTNFSCLHKK
jgi:hypothetical protein